MCEIPFGDHELTSLEEDLKECVTFEDLFMRRRDRAARNNNKIVGDPLLSSEDIDHDPKRSQGTDQWMEEDLSPDSF